ncbi:MAG: hypothetical protein JSV09_13895 [Thermoplasmata archaeon]|nr:MAG: hypothetical protein JSV09_13895 [Thermoplasmata archaeon]
MSLTAMDIKKRTSVSLITIIGIFIIGFIIGATILTGYVEYAGFDSAPSEVNAPSWKSGKYWTYSFKTPDIEDMVSRIVVASKEEGNYLTGVASRIDAQRHAVLNYNPMLGRIMIEDLSVYEKGIPQPLFDFPLKKNKQWSFSMFGIEQFNAKVESIKNVELPVSGKTVLVEIHASSSTGEKLTYSFDDSAKWIRSLVLEDSSESALLEMTLVSYGRDFSGEVYFVRGMDLYDEEFTSPALEVHNTLIEGHPDWGAFDNLIYHFEVLTESNSGGTLVVKDPLSEIEAMRRVFGPNTFENSLGTIPSDSEELSISVSLTGDAHLRLRVAGGIEYMWTI